jgi:hypothetical protein
MTEYTEQAGPTVVVRPTSEGTAHAALTRTDAIKRTTGPQTTNGSQWEVQLSAVPAPAWLEFFKRSGEGSASRAASPQPQRVVFDRASAVFKSDEDHVEQWIAAIDIWIARTEARYSMSLDEASRARSARLDAEARQRERIQQLNDRFKNL